MAKKKAKLSTPTWILEGFDSEADYNKSKGITEEKKEGKVFKIKECPKCGSDEIGLVLSNSDSEEGGGKEWQCRKCNWTGSEVVEKELTEDEFMKYLDDKGEDVA
jgi:hypothetical protein